MQRATAVRKTRRLWRTAALAAALTAACAGTAHASSVVYVKAGDIWASSPDGAGQVQITRGGGYAEPSQADDGTIVATRADGRLYRLGRDGALLNEPVATWLAGGAPEFTGPMGPVVSPDGRTIAYSWAHRESAYDYECGCYRERTDMGTAYSHADRYTDPNELGKFRGWSSPSWIDGSHTAVFDAAALGAASGSPNVAFHELGHADAGAEDDLGHVYGLLDDQDAPSIQFGAMTRAGDKFAGAEDVPALRLRFYALPGLPRPGIANYDARYRCQLEDPPGGHFDALSWAPDGSALAYAAGGDIYVVTVGNLDGGCTVGTPAKIVSGATSPSWGPAAAGLESTPTPTLAPGAVARVVRVRLAGRPHLAAVLRHGLRIRVTTPAAGCVRIALTSHGRTIATRGVASPGAGSRVVTVRIARSARRSLRHAHSLSATLSVRWSGGSRTALAKVHVSVPR